MQIPGTNSCFSGVYMWFLEVSPFLAISDGLLHFRRYVSPVPLTWNGIVGSIRSGVSYYLRVVDLIQH